MRTQVHKQPARSGSGRGYFVLAVVFTLAAGAAWFSINRENIREYIQTHESRELERARIAELKQRIAQLTRQQQSLAYNGVESEKQVRERHPYQFPGEKVIYFVEEETPTTATRPATKLTSAVEVSKAEKASPAVSETDSREKAASTNPAATGEIKSIYDAMPSASRSRP